MTATPGETHRPLPREERLTVAALVAGIASVVGVVAIIVGGSFWLGNLGATVTTTYESVRYTRDELRRQLGETRDELGSRINDAIRNDVERDNQQHNVIASVTDQLEALRVTVHELIRDNEWFKLLIQRQGLAGPPQNLPVFEAPAQMPAEVPG